MKHRFEVAALRADGKRSVFSLSAPVLPFFEQAFTAFTPGTMLAAPHGEMAIEDLHPGDWLDTNTGQPAQVVWIGSSLFIPADTGHKISLVRIMAHSFEQNRPARFVTVGPAARLLGPPSHLHSDSEKTLRPAHTFIDNINVIQITLPTPVRLFHLCLSRHATVNVAGIEMEGFHPGKWPDQSLTQAQRDLFLSMFPHIARISDFGPLAYPRISEAEGTQQTVPLL